MNNITFFAALITSQLKDSSNGVWIGLFKESSDDETFKWVDSSPLTFLNWAPNEPNSDFVNFALLLKEKKCSRFRCFNVDNMLDT